MRQNQGRKRRSHLQRHGSKLIAMSVAIGTAAIALLMMVAWRHSFSPQQVSAVVKPTELNFSLSNVPVRELHAFGDSITAGYGLEAGEAWPYVLAKRLHVQFDDSQMHAVLGGAVMDWGAKAYEVHPQHGDLSVILPGFNDVRANGDDVAKLQRYAASLGAYVTWLALPDEAKRQARDITYSGQWRDSKEFGRETSHAGNASASISGNTIYIGTWTTPQGGSFDVVVDGRQVQRVRTRGMMGNGGAASHTSRGAALVRIPGMGNRIHKVAITVLGDGPVAITWIGGSGLVSPSAPRVLLGDTLAMNSSAVGHVDEAYGHYTEAARQRYSEASRQLVAQLHQDGLQVNFVAAAAAYDPSTQVQEDKVHPDTSGRNTIAAAFTDALHPDLLTDSDRFGPAMESQAMFEDALLNKTVK